MTRITDETDGRRYVIPPETPLGEPKRKFSETFRAVPLIIEHFKRLVEEEKTK